MAKGKRVVPGAFVRVLDRRRSGAAGPHRDGRTVSRGADNRVAIRSSKEN